MKKITLFICCFLSFQYVFSQACGSTVDDLTAPAQTSICEDGSDLPVFIVPSSSLPDIQLVVEINGTFTAFTNDGIFDASSLNIGDEVCYTAFAYDLENVQNVLDIGEALCPALDDIFPVTTPCAEIFDLQNGLNDGVPGLNSLEEALGFASSLNVEITSIETALINLNNINTGFADAQLPLEICYATSNSICLPVVECTDSPEDDIPTLSQWGLIILALLLMTFGSLRLGFQNTSVVRN